MVRQIRPNIFRVRLSDEELQKLETYAESKQISSAEAIRDFIKRLPKPKTGGD
jgi:hypothetical protein